LASASASLWVIAGGGRRAAHSPFECFSIDLTSGSPASPPSRLRANGIDRSHVVLDSGPAGLRSLGSGRGGKAIARILVINPNSSDRITGQIRTAVATGTDVEVVTSLAGPSAIESDADVKAAVGPMLATAGRHPAEAVVVACFSDPGLDELRRQSTVPAFGIAESAIAQALRLGERIGIISSVEDSLPRHRRYWDKLGVQEHVVADIPLGLGVLELDTEEAFDRARRAGLQLVAAGADVVVLGCTGMTHMQDRLGEALGVPVIDPCSAAVDEARRAIAEEDS
jgi:Asp/Glu/hydantoin racemase